MSVVNEASYQHWHQDNDRMVVESCSCNGSSSVFYGENDVILSRKQEQVDEKNVVENMMSHGLN